jgi:hypothetical protein
MVSAVLTASAWKRIAQAKSDWFGRLIRTALRQNLLVLGAGTENIRVRVSADYSSTEPAREKTGQCAIEQ